MPGSTAILRDLGKEGEPVKETEGEASEVKGEQESVGSWKPRDYSEQKRRGSSTVPNAVDVK